MSYYDVPHAIGPVERVLIDLANPWTVVAVLAVVVVAMVVLVDRHIPLPPR